MFKYFSISDLQYFWKSYLYFCQKKFNQILDHLNWLRIWPLDGATFHLQVENLATIWCLIHCLHILVTRWSYVHWLHHLHCFQSWPPDCVTALPHCLELPHWHYQLVLSWYPHQPESHQLSLNKVAHSLTHGHPDPKIGPQVYLGSIKRRLWFVAHLIGGTLCSSDFRKVVFSAKGLLGSNFLDSVLEAGITKQKGTDSTSEKFK